MCSRLGRPTKESDSFVNSGTDSGINALLPLKQQAGLYFHLQPELVSLYIDDAIIDKGLHTVLNIIGYRVDLGLGEVQHLG